MSTERYHEGRRAGVRLAIEWLHMRADLMNDPHARQVLNSAAFNLGVALAQGRLVYFKSPKHDIIHPCERTGDTT